MQNGSSTVVISVGGSLIVPNDINQAFIARLKKVLEHQVSLGRKFVIIAGGGRTARHYQSTARQFRELSQEDIDWIGIGATRLNADLLRIVLGDLAYAFVVNSPEDPIETDKPIIVAGGWKPGASTDHVAVLLAIQLGATKMVNLTNIDFIYDVNEVNETGKVSQITDISWENFRKMLPEEWDPGAHVPFDPVASRMAHESGIEVASINGQIIEELEKYIAGERFRGTLIHP